MEGNNTNRFLTYLLEILKLMVESGAEIYRVEESAQHICTAYGMKGVDVYATTSNIIVSVEVEEGLIKTHTRRIGRISTDIERVDRLNSLVRNMSAKHPDLETVKEELDKVKDTPAYGTVFTLFFYAMIAAAFYLFFGGRSIVEFVISGVIGFCVGGISFVLSKIHANNLLAKFICSFFACMVTYACCRIGLAGRVDHIIIGNIMALIPGIGLTNSLRDLFIGDSVSGTLRFIEAIMLAIAIACGYIITSLLFGGGM